MVDFQSRDTSRSTDDDAESEAEDVEPDEEAAPPEETPATAADASSAEAETDPEAASDAESGAENGHGGEEHEHDHGGDGHEQESRDGDNDHDHHHHDLSELGTGVLTISSSRSIDEDPAGDVIAARMDEEGAVTVRELVPDDHDRIQDTVERLASREDVDTVVTTGGTGVTPDDTTIEAVRPLFKKELPGFGELFRILSHDEVGTKVVGTRATAGIVQTETGGVPVFCLPGSENAARLGVERIVSEEAGHLAGLASR